MSTLTEMYNKIMITERLIEISGSRKPQSTVIISGSVANCLITPVTEVTQLWNNANIGDEYELYCDFNEDIRVNDLVNIGSVKYGVLGVPEYPDFEDGESSGDAHKEVRIVRRRV